MSVRLWSGLTKKLADLLYLRVNQTINPQIVLGTLTSQSFVGSTGSYAVVNATNAYITYATVTNLTATASISALSLQGTNISGTTLWVTYATITNLSATSAIIPNLTVTNLTATASISAITIDAPTVSATNLWTNTATFNNLTVLKTATATTIGIGAAPFLLPLTINTDATTIGQINIGGGAYNGVIESENSVYIDIDSDNDQTNRIFAIRHNGQGQAGGTELFRVDENGTISGTSLLVLNSTLTNLTATASISSITLSAPTISGTNLYSNIATFNNLTVINSSTSASIFGTSILGLGTGANTNSTARFHSNVDSTWNFNFYSSYNAVAANVAAQLSFVRGRGTLAVPSAVLSGDTLGYLNFAGEKDTTINNHYNAASIRGIAAENFNTTSGGTYLAFFVTPTGTATQVEKIRLTSEGLLSCTNFAANSATITNLTATNTWISNATFTNLTATASISSVTLAGTTITGTTLWATYGTFTNLTGQSVTQAPGDNSTKLATTAYVDAAGGGTGTITGSGADTYVSFFSAATVLTASSYFVYLNASNTLSVTNVSFNGMTGGNLSATLISSTNLWANTTTFSYLTVLKTMTAATIGIGTSAPAALLDASNSSDAYIRAITTGAGGFARLRAQGELPTVAFESFQFGSTYAGNDVIGVSNAALALLYTGSSTTNLVFRTSKADANILFGTQNIERLRITSGGLVSCANLYAAFSTVTNLNATASLSSITLAGTTISGTTLWISNETVTNLTVTSSLTSLWSSFSSLYVGTGTGQSISLTGTMSSITVSSTNLWGTSVTVTNLRATGVSAGNTISGTTLWFNTSTGNNLYITGTTTSETIVGRRTKNLRFTIVNPSGFCAISTHTCLIPKLSSPITITNLEVTLNTAAYEVAGDIKYADTYIGTASPAVINDFDTSSGVRSDASITGASVPTGKCIFIEFDSAPNSTITSMTIDLTYMQRD